jgi:hypothetical protein
LQKAPKSGDELAEIDVLGVKRCFPRESKELTRQVSTLVGGVDDGVEQFAVPLVPLVLRLL